LGENDNGPLYTVATDGRIVPNPDERREWSTVRVTTGREEPKCPEKSSLIASFVHHKSQADFPCVQCVSSWWKLSQNCRSDWFILTV